MSLPVVPGTFTAGEHTITDLQALANCARFLSVADMHPAWHLYRTATQSLTASVNNVLTMNTVAFDSDSVSDGTGALIVTQGMYAVEACVPLSPGTTVLTARVMFAYIGGANSYHNGSTLYFGGRGNYGTTIAANDTAICARATCPWTCFAGDKLQVVVIPTAGVTLNNNVNTNAFSGRYAPTFTGEWIRTGS